MAKQWTPVRVRDESERRSGSSDFINLDEGEKFLGYFLGEGDPKIDDPAYFEYKTHWTGKTSVPCAGEDDCPYCQDGDRPRTKAMTLWLVLQDAAGNKLGKDGEGELRIWDMSISVIKQLTELRSEDEKLKGRLFRASRPDEKTYMLLPKTEVLKVSEVKALLKDAPDFEQMLTVKLRKAMEGVALSRAMEDNDDDDAPPARGKSAPSRQKKVPDAPDEDEMPEEAQGLEVTISKVNDENSIMVIYGDNKPVKVWGTEEVDVTDLEKGAEVAISYETDEEDDYVLTDDPEVAETPAEEAEEEVENTLPEAIDGGDFEITEINVEEQTIDVEGEDLEFTLWFLDKGPASKIDFDDYEVGDKITFTAEKDSMGDMVATSVPEKPAAKRAPRKTTASRKAAPARKTTARRSPAKGK